MVVSFTISRTGIRYKPKPKQNLTIPDDDPVGSEPSDDNEFQKSGFEKGNKDAAGVSSSFLSSGECIASADAEVSFTLNLFQDGYSLVKPTEDLTVAVQENPKLLHPYDRTSETFFAAIESGRVPGDLLNDIPCKYVNGTIVCEVQDYRKCALETGKGTCVDLFPTVHKVSLKMSLENIVKDITALADGCWSYRDLMEVESRILKTLYPNLYLDPTPNLDRLCEESTTKLNLDIRSMRKKRLRQVPEVTVTCHTNSHGKKVCIDRVSESSSCRVGVIGDQVNVPSDLMLQQNDTSNSLQGARSCNYVSDVSSPQLPMVHNQPRNQVSLTNQRLIQEHGSGAPLSGQDILSYTDNAGMSSLHGKRENTDGQQSALSSRNYKRPRPTLMGVDTTAQLHVTPFVDAFQGQTVEWKNSMLQQQFQASGIQYTGSGDQRYQSHMFDGFQNPAQGTRFVSKEEQIDMDKLDGPKAGQRRNSLHLIEQDTSNLDPKQLQFGQRLRQNAFNRPGFSSQAPWNSLGQQMEIIEDQHQKKQSAPRLSAGSLAQSSLASKSVEFPSGSLGAQFKVGPAAPSYVTSQKDNKGAIGTASSVDGVTYMTSSGNDSMQRKQPPKRRTNSLPKTQALSSVASPASVSTTSVRPPNMISPSIGTPPIADLSILERFMKIESVAKKFNLNAKKKKVDNFIRKSIAHSTQLVAQNLTLVSTVNDIKDDNWPLSKSIVSGSTNAPKTRRMNFMQPESTVQGSVHSGIPRMRTRLLMADKSNDGTVAMHFGEIEDCEFMAVEDYLQTLPNAHKADLLASQYCSLMIREGCLVEDYVQLKPMRLSSSPNNEPGGYLSTSNKMQRYDEDEMYPAANKVANQNSLIQLQQSQIQQPPLMNEANPPAHLKLIGQGSNMQLGNHMVNKPSPLQMQMLQQQAQRNMLMGLGNNMGTGNMGSNLGLGALGNGMNIGTSRGIGGVGISSPAGPIAGVGNIDHNPLVLHQNANINAISHQLRSGQVTKQQAALLMAAKMRMYGQGMLGQSAQPSLAGISGARRTHPSAASLAMLGHTLNRTNINPMQQSAGIGPMGNPYMNQQLQLQQQQMHQQLQQQKSGSSLQAVVSPPAAPQVSSQSPSTPIVMPQPQMASPQQMSQQPPMSPQLISGTIPLPDTWFCT